MASSRSKPKFDLTQVANTLFLVYPANEYLQYFPREDEKKENIGSFHLPGFHVVPRKLLT